MDLKNMNYDEKEALATNPSTSLDILCELAKDEDVWVRRQVAYNPSAPEDVLRELAKDEYWVFREHVAENPSTPEDILRELAKDTYWYVRENVAWNPKASSKILVMQFEYEKSLRNPSKSIIKALYAHKNLPAFAKRVIETLFGEILT